MAQRLATEYKNVSLTLSKEELTEFIRLFRMNNARVEEKVLDHGEHEITLYGQNDQVNLIFEEYGPNYRLSGNCLFKDRSLAELMRKAMASFKGEAVVYRIFQSFIIEYCYELGTIKSIRELNDLQNNYIFENNDFSFYLQKIFANKEVENEITDLRNSIDKLLDKRFNYQSISNSKVDHIDKKLNHHAVRLNHLEA